VLKQHLGPGEHREEVAGWETVLSFDFWYRLTRGHRLPRPAVRRVIMRSLDAIAGPQDASPTKASARRKR
jgi:hypothetical protein